MECQHFIVQPLPGLSDFSQPTNREEKLKTIINNLETQQGNVRASIIAAGQNKLDSLSDGQTQAQVSNDETDIDSSSSPTTAADRSALITAVSAPYVTGSGDPCVRASDLHKPLDPRITQAPVPLAVKVTEKVTEQLEAYDRHARATRDYYVKALDRQRGVGGGMTSADVSRDPRRNR